MSSNLTIHYQNLQFGLSFLLPASWQGFSVSIEQLEYQNFSPAQDKQITVGYTPIITLRHPQWQAGAPYQAIPILVFTRAQWDTLHRGELWPSAFAGGTMDELWHNQKFVFAMSSRYNAADEVTGGAEVASIFEKNRTLNEMPRL